MCIALETNKLASKDIKETTQKSWREKVQNNGPCMIKYDSDVENNAKIIIFFQGF